MISEQTNDALSEQRQFYKRLITHATKKEFRAVIFSLLEGATREEQLRAIELAIIHGVLVSNPKMFRQLDNGNWVLRNPPPPQQATA